MIQKAQKCNIQEFLVQIFESKDKETSKYYDELIQKFINHFPSLGQELHIPENRIEETIKAIHIFEQIYEQLLQLAKNEEIDILLLLRNTWNFYLPYAQKLAKDYQTHKQNNDCQLPLIYGLLGVQGAGKTTLGSILTIIFKSQGINLTCISIDDFYKTYQERIELQKNDPRLAYLVDRGPPGTHDIYLALQTFLDARKSWKQYIQSEISEPEITIPQFDKSLHKGKGDRIEPLIVKNPQIIIFEGWFLGYRHIMNIDSQLKLQNISKEDYQFAVEMNEKLKDYDCLWDLLKELIILMPEKFNYSIKWRMEAEQKMKKKKGFGKTDEEIEAFVKYFFRALDPEIFINNLINSKRASLVIKVNYSHEIIECLKNN